MRGSQERFFLPVYFSVSISIYMISFAVYLYSTFFAAVGTLLIFSHKNTYPLLKKSE